MAKREKAPGREKAPKRAKAQKREEQANITVRGKNVHIKMPASALKDLEVKGEAGKVRSGGKERRSAHPRRVPGPLASVCRAAWV